jgi:Uma2 family endonuclease
MPTLELQAPTRLSLETAGALMTPEEFDSVEDQDANYVYELVNGVLVVHAIPLPEETGPNEFLGLLLGMYQMQHPKGGCLDATIPQQHVRLKKSRRIADRLIWIGLGRLPNVRRDVAAIAVEFVSAGKRNRLRDYVYKKRDYMAVGVKEYWIIDRFQRTLTVISKVGGKIIEKAIPESRSYRTPLLPGFELPLAQLLAMADRWAEQNDS